MKTVNTLITNETEFETQHGRLFCRNICFYIFNHMNNQNFGFVITIVKCTKQ